MNEHSPIVSEFETPEQEASYLEWLKRKVAEALADPRPPISHDEAMRRARAAIENGKSKKAC